MSMPEFTKSPDWAKWIAMDVSGEWWWYAEKPAYKPTRVTNDYVVKGEWRPQNDPNGPASMHAKAADLWGAWSDEQAESSLQSLELFGKTSDPGTVPGLPPSHMFAAIDALGIPLTHWYTLAQMEEYAAQVAARAVPVPILLEAEDWLPIDSAPMDGTPLIVYGRFPGARVPIEHIAAWHSEDGKWCAQSNAGPIWLERVTHWMRRPGPPKGEE